MFRKIKEYFVGPEVQQNTRDEKLAKSLLKHCQDYEDGLDNVEHVSKNLVYGQLSENTNWQYIQEVGKYISPVGDDPKHKVIIYRNRPSTPREKIAEIECTNNIYSEWIIACCNTMWKSKRKVLEDMHGNKYPLGKMLQTSGVIEY